MIHFKTFLSLCTFVSLYYGGECLLNNEYIQNDFPLHNTSKLLALSYEILFSSPFFSGLLIQIMNAIKAAEEILRPKSPSVSTNQSYDTNTIENHPHEQRTTLIKMAGTSTGAGVSGSNELISTTASLQETSTVSYKRLLNFPTISLWFTIKR